MNGVPLISALSMGFLGSLHCAGMCGPIMLVLPFQGMQGWRKWLALAGYHLGRISMYAAMGLLLFSFRSLFRPQWQQYISVILGVTLLLAGLLSFAGGAAWHVKLPWAGAVRKYIALQISKTGMMPVLVMGMLNGLLPCGLVYAALSLAVTAGNALDAVAVMYAFGLGTVPMLLAVLLLRGRLGWLQAGKLRGLAPMALLLMGVLLTLRGMNLGVPYLSPKVAVEQGVVHSSCCRK